MGAKTYNILQYPSGYANTHAAIFCNSQQSTATHRKTLQQTATDEGGETSAPLYNTLQQWTSDRNKRQYPATYCNTLQHTRATRLVHRHKTHYNKGHQTATKDNTPQHTATDEGYTISSPLSSAMHILQLQHIAQHTATHSPKSRAHCSHKPAYTQKQVCCSVLQCVAAHHI